MLAAQAVTAFQGWPLMVPQPPGLGHQAEAGAAATSESAAAAVQLAAEPAAAAVQQATEAAEAAVYHQSAAEEAAAKATAAMKNQVAVQAAADQHQLSLVAAAAVPPPRALPVRQGRAAPGTPVGGLLEGASGARDRSKTLVGMQPNGIGF